MLVSSVDCAIYLNDKGRRSLLILLIKVFSYPPIRELNLILSMWHFQRRRCLLFTIIFFQS